MTNLLINIQHHLQWNKIHAKITFLNLLNYVIAKKKKSIYSCFISFVFKKIKKVIKALKWVIKKNLKERYIKGRLFSQSYKGMCRLQILFNDTLCNFYCQYYTIFDGNRSEIVNIGFEFCKNSCEPP